MSDAWAQPPRAVARQTSTTGAIALARVVAAVCIGVALSAGAPSSALAQSVENVAIVVNDNSADSQRIAEYYARVRGLPETNVLRIKTSTGDTIERGEYLKTIEQPIGLAIRRNGLQDRLLYLVLTKGVPLRIAGTTGVEGTLASVDSELTLLYRRMVGQPVLSQGRIDNPYFLGDRPISQAVPFTHREHDIYLVTRLDAFTVDQALALIDRAQAPSVAGQVIFDRRGAVGAGGQWIDRAAERLKAQETSLADTSSGSPRERRAIGFYAAAPVFSDSQGELDLQFVPGAIAASFTSFDARTLRQPPGDWRPSTSPDKKTWFEESGAPLMGDLIRRGATGAAGQVGESYVMGAIHPEIVFPAYLAGFNLAESFYLSIPTLSWQTVVIGDPLCRPGGRSPLGRGQVEAFADEGTGLPGHFAKRRMATLVAANPEVPAAALSHFLRSQTFLERDDRAGARRALEEAVALAPRASGLISTLAQLEEQAGEYDTAIEHYRRAIEAQGTNVVALNNLAFALAVRRGAPGEALPFAKRAASLAPRNGSVLDTLGWVAHLTGDDALAANELDRAVLLEPGLAEIRLHAAIAYEAIGQVERAETELNEALRLDPSLGERDDVRRLRAGIELRKQPAGSRR